MRLFATILEQVFGGKKEVPEPRVVDDAGVDIKTGKYIGDPGDTFSHEEKVKKVFAEALEMIDYKECGCLPDCGCKDS